MQCDTALDKLLYNFTATQRIAVWHCLDKMLYNFTATERTAVW
jgi:hypothetical protein